MNPAHETDPAIPEGRPAGNNEESNARYFDSWKDYQQLVDNIDTYRLTRQALVGELRGRVVDVGSGGVVNYSCQEITELVLVDIGTEFLGHVTLPECAVAHIGTAVSLPLRDGMYNCVLMQMLVHHLAETDYRSTRARVEKAFREAFRVLKPGGKLVVVESVVPKPLELAQRWAFGVTRRILARMGHPVVFQWTSAQLCDFAKTAGFTGIHATRVPLGKSIIFLGRRCPTTLVPISISKIVATKAEST